MSRNVFISYSHKDETFKEALDEHLSMLKRGGTIDAWHDRRIVASEDWSREISEHLENSELILFLISSSFLSSDYCVDVEVQRAVELHEEGRAQIIPILVRPCDWNSSSLSRFQGLPKDVLPITKWANSDEAWLDVVNGIKKYLSQFSPKKKVNSQVDLFSPCQTSACVSKKMLDWLDDTEVVMSHRKVSKVKLSDIYIALDMEEQISNPTSDVKIINTDSIIDSKKKYFIYGEEQQGKTTLLKHLFSAFAQCNAGVVYIDAKDIKNSDLQKILQPILDVQYDNLNLSYFDSLQEKVILIDNFHELGLNSKFRSILLESIKSYFNTIVISCASAHAFVTQEIAQLEEYSKYDLLGLGHLKRAELVEKWVSLGVEESINDSELISQCDEFRNRLNSVIRKNIVPAKPIYVLMLLQMFEAYSQQNLELSSYGHCYQQLVYQAFDSAHIPKNEVDRYLNVLTELSWDLYKNHGAINQHQIEQFFLEYQKTYLSVDGKLIIGKLKSNSILHERDFKIEFKYPYLYYFFVAKKIAESFSTSEDTRNEITNLIGNLHREDYANILVFVTHHTKERWVLEQIQNALDSLFSDHAPATLSKDELSFMQEFIAKIPELVMEQREVRGERMRHEKELDDQERLIENDDVDDNLSIDIPAQVNKTFKGMEIAGQIIRNRHAALPRTTLLDLAQKGAFSGLRFLRFFIEITDAAKTEVIKHIEQNLIDNPKLSDSAIQQHATNHFMMLTYGVINGAIRKIASAIGSKEAGEIYKNLIKDDENPAIILLKQSIELQFDRVLNVDSVNETFEKVKNNAVCARILKEMVIQHTYMFPVGYKEKQKLAERLKLSVQGQRLLDRKKIAKG